MPGLISIKQLIFISAVRNLEAAGEELNTTVLSVDTGEFNSPALSGYMESFENLRQVFLLYKALIEEDAVTLMEVSRQFESFDSFLARLWRRP